MKIFITITALFCVFVSCTTYKNYESEELNQKLDNDPKIRTGVLENGFRYVLRVNKVPAGKAEFRLGIQGGSLIEEDDEQGLAHFMEHMAFNGTRHFNQKQLLDFFRENGMSFGHDLNAYTSHTETVYRFSLPSQKPETVEKGLLLLNQDFSDLAAHEKYINELTPESLLSSAKRFLDDRNMVISVLNPKKSGRNQ